MKIDWFTIVAQVINFLVLVWLLKKFLYKPILDAIEHREKKISSQIAQAEEQKSSAEKERLAFQAKNDELSKTYDSLVNKAKESANTEGEKLIEVARKEAEASRTKLEESLVEQQKKFEKDFLRQGQHQVFDMLHKVVKDLSSSTLEEQMIEVFLKQINHLDQDQKEKLKTAISNNKTPVLIATCFPLSADQKSHLEKVVQEVLALPITFQYKESIDLISGIELSTQDYKITWTVSNYLNTLEENSDKSLDEKILSGSI